MFIVIGMVTNVSLSHNSTRQKIRRRQLMHPDRLLTKRHKKMSTHSADDQTSKGAIFAHKMTPNLLTNRWTSTHSVSVTPRNQKNWQKSGQNRDKGTLSTQKQLTGDRCLGVQSSNAVQWAELVRSDPKIEVTAVRHETIV